MGAKFESLGKASSCISASTYLLVLLTAVSLARRTQDEGVQGDSCPHRFGYGDFKARTGRQGQQSPGLWTAP